MSFIIDHDLHIHTQLSSCSNHPEQTPAAILNYAVENHLRHICLADHFWDETVPGASGWYEPQNYGHVTKALPLPAADGIRFDFGCETDMNRFGTLGISRETLDRFDFVIVPTNHLHMGIFSVPMQKFSKLLWVCAPQYLSAGTCISPIESFSIRYSIFVASPCLCNMVLL
jgi:histidinol phosphatase-like PHP family hydrolase